MTVSSDEHEEPGAVFVKDPFHAIRQHGSSRLENHLQVYHLLQACESTMAQQGLSLEPEHYFRVLVSNSMS